VTGLTGFSFVDIGDRYWGVEIDEETIKKAGRGGILPTTTTYLHASRRTSLSNGVDQRGEDYPSGGKNAG